MHSLEDRTFERRVLPESPETIHTERCALINSLVRELGIGAVMVTALEGSSIEKHLDEMAALIRDEGLSSAPPSTKVISRSDHSSLGDESRNFRLGVLQHGQRLVGLVMAALSNDPFASRFVTASNRDAGIPLVECTFGFFDVALGLEAEAASRVFREVVEFMIHEEFSTGRPFFFNT